MRRKILCIIVCGLLIATTIVFVPKDKNVRADPGGGEGSGEIGLDYDYLWKQIYAVANVIHDDEVWGDNDIRKGRQFGSKGDEYTWERILIPEMQSMGLDDVHEEKMQHIDSIDKYYTSIIDIGGFNLTVNNESYEQMYGFSNNIPKSEVFYILIWYKYLSGI